MSDVTEEPPVGSVVRDRAGVTWQRWEDGWNATDGSEGHLWTTVRQFAPLTLLQPAELRLPGKTRNYASELVEMATADDVAVLQRHIDSLRDRVLQLDLAQRRQAERVQALERKVERALLLAEEANMAAQALEQAWLTDAPTEEAEANSGPWRAAYFTATLDPWGWCVVAPNDACIARCQTEGHANAVASALNAGPSPEVQAVVEAAKAWRKTPVGGSYIGMSEGASAGERLAAAVDALIAKEATTDD